MSPDSCDIITWVCLSDTRGLSSALWDIPADAGEKSSTAPQRSLVDKVFLEAVSDFSKLVFFCSPIEKKKESEKLL
jgi:hypothetical protein